MHKTFIQLSNLKQAAKTPPPPPQSILLALVCEAWPFALKAQIKEPDDDFYLTPGWEKTAMEMLGQLFTCFERRPDTRALRAYMSKWKRGRRLFTEDATVEESLNTLKTMRYRKLKHPLNPFHPKAVSVQHILISIKPNGRLKTAVEYSYPRDDGSGWVTHENSEAKEFHNNQNPDETPGNYLKRMIHTIESMLEPLPDQEHARPSFKLPAPSHALVMEREKLFELLQKYHKIQDFSSHLAPDPRTAAFFGNQPTSAENALSSLIAEFYTQKAPFALYHMLIQKFQEIREILHPNQIGKKFLRSMERHYNKLQSTELPGMIELPGPDYTLLDQCKKAAASAKCKTYLLLPKSSTAWNGLEYIPLNQVRINRKEHYLYRKRTGGPNEKFDLGAIREICCVPASYKLENPE
jgi:hypothetical protein